METLGQRLRAEREKRGLTIEHLAAETRINARYFEAIEDDRLADLPSGFFYRSFVRQYARMLSIPEQDYMPAIERSLTDEALELDKRETALPERNIAVPPMPTGRFNPALEARRWFIRLALLVAVIAASTGLYSLYQKWRLPAPQTAAVVEPQEAPQPTPPAAKQDSPPVEPQAGPAAGATEAGLAPAQQAEPPKPPPQAPLPRAAMTLRIAASADTWMQVVADGKPVFTDLLRTGQSQTFTGDRFMRVRLGNAGGVSMEFNGSAVPPPGPLGQVRTVEFTPEGSRVVPPQIVKPEITPLLVPQQEQ